MRYLFLYNGYYIASIPVPVEARLELACAEVRNLLLAQSDALRFLRLVAFFDTTNDVKQWVSDNCPDWIKLGCQQQELV